MACLVSLRSAYGLVASTFGVGKSTVYDTVKSQTQNFPERSRGYGDYIKKRKIVREADFAASEQNIVATCVQLCQHIFGATNIN